MTQITVGLNQTLIDIAVQVYGTPDMLPALLADNPGISLAAPFVQPGQVLQVRESAYAEQQAVPSVVDAYVAQGRKVAILDPSGDAGGMPTQPEGIGFMEIENDFEVQ